MAPRFNKEPINLIHRIPSQKQIDEARPVQPAYGQLLLEAGSLCVRKVREFFSYITRYESDGLSRFRKPLALPDYRMAPPAPHEGYRPQVSLGENVNIVEAQPQEAGYPLDANISILQKPAPVATAVPPDEVAKLRACLVGQQDEIARLTSHIQELTSLVTSQQQVLVHLGKEMEAGAFPTVSNGTAAATIKRSRVGRKKPAASEASTPSQDSDQPFHPQEKEGPSLSL